MTAPRMMSVAHRGFSARYPENSRAACEAAIEAGANYVEVDARLSSDGVVICCHDPDLERISGKPDVINRTPADALMDIDIGAGEKPMRLGEVFDLYAGRIKVLVDLKQRDINLLAAVVDCVDAADARAVTVIGLRSLQLLRHAKAVDPNLQCLGLVGDYDEIPEFLASGAMAVRAWEDDVDHPAVVAALSGGQPVWVTAGLRGCGEVAGYTTRERLEHLRRAGVHAVLLNDPTLMTPDGDRAGLEASMGTGK